MCIQWTFDNCRRERWWREGRDIKVQVSSRLDLESPEVPRRPVLPDNVAQSVDVSHFISIRVLVEASQRLLVKLLHIRLQSIISLLSAIFQSVASTWQASGLQRISLRPFLEQSIGSWEVVPRR